MIGPLVGGEQVCAAVTETLQTWLPSVMLEVQAAGGPALTALDAIDVPDLPTLADARTAKRNVFAVTSPGLAGTRTRRDGQGQYDASWTVVVFYVVAGASFADTTSRVRWSAVAIRTALLQHASLGGFAKATEWVDENYLALDPRAARTLGAGHVELTVTAGPVLDARGGPATPPDPPAVSQPSPTAVDVDVTVTRKD